MSYSPIREPWNYPRRGSILPRTARGTNSAAANRFWSSNKQTTLVPPAPPALVRYQPGFDMPEPMEALRDLSLAVAGRRRRSRLNIAGIGGM